MAGYRIIASDGLKAAAGVLAVDMNELTEAVVAPGSDSFMFIDNDGNVTRGCYCRPCNPTGRRRSRLLLVCLLSMLTHWH